MPRNGRYHFRLPKLSRRAWIALTALGVLGFVGLAWVGLFGDLPDTNALIQRSSPDATKIYDRQGRLLFEVLDPRAGRRTRVSLQELPLYFRQAVIAVEDASYYEHPGVDAVGVARAAWQFALEGHIVSGGSTITQQLARDLLLSQEERESRTVLRKAREMVLALRLTQAYPKDTILEMYLNEVYFGQLAYGAEAAARTYFGKPARDLDLAESALLAGLIQSPAAYNPLVDLDAAKQRQSVVLGLMVKKGLLDQAEAQVAEKEPLHFAAQDIGGRQVSNTVFRAPHFVTYVRNLLEAQYGAEAVNHGGFNVVTTLDLDLQEQAEQIIKQRLRDLARKTREEGAPDYNLHDAALVAMDPKTGEILAMVGSADYSDASIDGAVNVALADRQPGSSIKAITYATAFSRDLTPATVYSDVPTSFLTKENEPYSPQNYDLAWHGPISLRRALATSSNLVAVKVLDHVGLPAMIDTAKALGISTFDDSSRFGLSLTLGGGEVKLFELTAAYAGFANGGRQIDPVAILSVNGSRPAAAPPGRQAVSAQVAFLISDILSDDSARIPAFGEDSVLKLSRPAAVKTGTTSDFRDNWTVGYTPDLAVGVWAGNANNDPMYKISGITGAAPIWHDFMEVALAGTTVHPFTRPPGVVAVDICDSSGLLPTEYCPRVRTEWFIEGSEPKNEDDTYRPLAIDIATGLVWGDGCRGPKVERVYRLLPPEAQDWGRKNGIPEPPTSTCTGQAVALKGAAPSSAAAQMAAAPTGPALVVVSPPANSTFELSPQLPVDLQQVEVAARIANIPGVHDVKLLIDGEPIAAFPAPPFRTLWKLVLGQHQVQAIGLDGSGNVVQSEIVRFSVQEP